MEARKGCCFVSTALNTIFGPPMLYLQAHSSSHNISVSSSPEPKASNYLRMNIPTKLFADAVLIHFLHLSSPYSAPFGERGHEGRKDTDVRRRGDGSGPLMVLFCLLFIFRECQPYPGLLWEKLATGSMKLLAVSTGVSQPTAGEHICTRVLHYSCRARGQLRSSSARGPLQTHLMLFPQQNLVDSCR